MARSVPLCALLALAACNAPPEGTEVRIDPQAPGTLSPLVAVLATPAVDPQDDPVSYRYTWRRDGEPTELDGDTVPASATRAGEVWSVSVVPSDGREAGAAATAETTVLNTPPTASVTLQPERPDVDDALEAFVETDDADGEVVEVTYAWLLDGSPQAERTRRIPADRTRKGQVWEVVVTPSDAEGPGEQTRASVSIGNTAPNLDSASIEPGELHRGLTATCAISGWEDADGDPAGARIAWFVDGTEVGTEDALDLAPHARGSEVWCIATPFDGEDAGESVTSDRVVIGNAPPRLDSVAIGPEDPRARTDVTATVEGITDPDGDSVSLRWSWTVDGVVSSSIDRLPGNRFVRDQDIVVEVTPTDGTDDGETVRSNVLTAANTPPVIGEVVLDPVDPATDEDVFASVTASDVDGDSITLSYAWQVDGSTVSGTTGDTLASDSFVKHETITVTVTPSDSESGALVTSDDAIVVNTPPPAPVLAFSPAEPDPDEDVTCTIDSQEPDLDGDSLTYTFAWTLDGTAYTSATTTTHTGDTIPASARDTDDRWVCSVTPHDGDDNGDVASAALGEEPTGFDTTGSLSNSPLRGGSMAGTLYNDDCPSGSFLVGLSADLTGSGGYFAELAPRCAELELSCSSSSCTVTTDTITTGTYRGGSGRLVVDRDCPSGSVVTGFTGRAGWYLDQLTLRCAPVSVSRSGGTWGASLGSTSDLSALGGTGGGAFSRSDCSSGQVATRARIRAASSQVDGFGLGCRALDLIVE